MLLLNKDDLFREQLAQGHSLSLCFNADSMDVDDYDAPIWSGPDYDQTRDDSADLSVCYSAALSFVLQRYLELNPLPTRSIVHHVICATDTDRIQKAFDQIQNTVVQTGLRRNGLISTD